MKSDLHKVLHPIAGRPMLAHLLASVDELGPHRTVVVVGERARAGRSRWSPRMAACSSCRSRSMGTAHAVQQAEAALGGFRRRCPDPLSRDTPFVTRGDDARDAGAAARAGRAGGGGASPSRPADPKHYGRILAEPDGTIVKMVEYKDASEEERALDLCNSGLMAVRAGRSVAAARAGRQRQCGGGILPSRHRHDRRGATGEASAVIEVTAAEVEGDQQPRRAGRRRGRLAGSAAARQAMADGVSLIAPETVWFAYDTKLGRDVDRRAECRLRPRRHRSATASGSAPSPISRARRSRRAREIGPYRAAAARRRDRRGRA